MMERGENAMRMEFQLQALPEYLFSRLSQLAGHLDQEARAKKVIGSKELNKIAKEVRRLQVVTGYLLVLKEFACSPLGDSIDALDLTTESKNSLLAESISQIGYLVLWTEAELLECPGMGPVRMKNIKSALAKRGLALAEK